MKCIYSPKQVGSLIDHRTTTLQELNQSDCGKWLENGAIFSCEPEKVLIAWGRSSWHAAPDPDGSTWCYFPDYFLKNPNPWLHFEKYAIVEIGKLSAMLESITTEPSETIRWENHTKDIFEQGFHDLHRLFLDAELEKAVPYIISKASTRLSLGHRKCALSGILKYLQEAPVFAYGFWEESQGLLGATPEILFRTNPFQSHLLETMALAGTQKTNSMPRQMLRDRKLQHEFQIVVDDIAARLTPFGKVSVGLQQVLSLPMLSHIYRPISVELEQECEFSSFVTALHPTPALGGFPQKSALKFLREYDKLLPRGRFGAPAGFWDSRSGKKTCYVAIRNVTWDETELAIGAGCGIVAESSLEKEWEEVLLKTQSIIRFLQL